MIFGTVKHYTREARSAKRLRVRLCGHCTPTPGKEDARPNVDAVTSRISRSVFLTSSHPRTRCRPRTSPALSSYSGDSPCSPQPMRNGNLLLASKNDRVYLSCTFGLCSRLGPCLRIPCQG